MIETIRQAIRRGIRRVAVPLNSLTRGTLTPNTVTWFGFAMHAPIAWLVATQHNLWAAILLVFFGLFDTLDGELARLQKRDSAQGMLLDASTDRMKEVLLYSGAAYALARDTHPAMAAWAVAACGASLCVSYVKAKGEAAVAASRKDLTHTQLNKLFSAGLWSFEIRMVVLILGLISNRLLVAVIAIAIFASYTALDRLTRISRQLS